MSLLELFLPFSFTSQQTHQLYRQMTDQKENSGKIIFSVKLSSLQMGTDKLSSQHCTIFATYFALATRMHPMTTNKLTYNKTPSKSLNFSLNKFPSGLIDMQIQQDACGTTNLLVFIQYFYFKIFSKNSLRICFISLYYKQYSLLETVV